MRIAVYYAIWIALCAGAAGTAVAVIHTAFFSGAVGWPALGRTFLSGTGVALAIAAGQGIVALGTGAVLARLGRALRMTVLLGLVLGLFDFIMYMVQMLVPATELGWGPDLLILAAVVGLVTVMGSASNKGV